MSTERGIGALHAQVDLKNTASLRMFLACGFLWEGTWQGFAALRWPA